MPEKQLENMVGLPMRPFLYTLDQIAEMIQVDLSRLKKAYIHFEDRSVGFRQLDRMMARNIAPQGERPEWRVADRELARWLTHKGYRVYLRGWTSK